MDMALTKIEKDWLDERFGRLDDKMLQILNQVQKTNGRVNLLEDKEARHIMTCPISTKVEKIKDDLEEYRFIKKYPKVFILGMVVYGVAIILLFLLNIGFIG